MGIGCIFRMLPSPPLIARTLTIALPPVLSVGLRDGCERDLGGTENLVKPSENLGKKLGETPTDEEITGGVIHEWVGSTFLTYISISSNNSNNNSNDG